MMRIGAAVPAGLHSAAGAFVGQGRRHDREVRRSRRVVLLLLGIVALSALDLGLTLHHLSTLGMDEINPLAAALVGSTGSAWPLVLFKVATAGVCVVLLYKLRRHAPSEVGAWIGLVVLGGLTFVWLIYSLTTSGIDPAALEMLTLHDAGWLRIDGAGGGR